MEAFAALTVLMRKISCFPSTQAVSQGKIDHEGKRIAFENVIDSMNLGSVIYPKLITADLILQYVGLCRILLEVM